MSEKPGFSRVNQISADEQSMAQIREILFGEQTRQTEQQFDRLDARLGEQEQAFRTLLDRQAEQLDGRMQQLRDALEAQERRQDAALEQLNGTLTALLSRLDERVTLLDSDQQDARQLQQQDAKDQAEALDRLEQRSTGRQQLAELLEAMAGELRRSPNAD